MIENHRIQFERPNLAELKKENTVVDLHFHSHYSDGFNRVKAIARKAPVTFVPAIIEALDSEPTSACYALGKLSSEDGVYALIGMLDNEDMQVRDAAVWGLGSLPYVSGMETATMTLLRLSMPASMLRKKNGYTRISRLR